MRVVPSTQPLAELDVAKCRNRLPLYHPSLPFVLLWSEKAACTTVVKWFFLQVGLLEEALAYRPWVHEYENQVFKAQPGYVESVLQALQSGVPAVKFTRDPFARAYSGYLEICRTAVVTVKGHWARPVRRRILRALLGTDVEIEYAFSFRQYVEWLCHQDVAGLNSHLSPQYLPRDDYFDVRVAQVESLREALAELEREAGCKQSLPDELLVSGHHHTKSSTLSRHQQLAMLELAVPLRRPESFHLPGFDRELARGTEYETKLARMFGEDIGRYGY